MVKFVFPYHDDFYLDTDTEGFLLLNGLGCPSKDENDEVQVLFMVVKTKYGYKVVKCGQFDDNRIL